MAWLRPQRSLLLLWAETESDSPFWNENVCTPLVPSPVVMLHLFSLDQLGQKGYRLTMLPLLSHPVSPITSRWQVWSLREGHTHSLTTVQLAGQISDQLAPTSTPPDGVPSDLPTIVTLERFICSKRRHPKLIGMARLPLHYLPQISCFLSC